MHSISFALHFHFTLLFVLFALFAHHLSYPSVHKYVDHIVLIQIHFLILAIEVGLAPNMVETDGKTLGFHYLVIFKSVLVAMFLFEGVIRLAIFIAGFLLLH